MKIDNVYYLPSGRIFVLDCGGSKLECTEMRDVNIQGKENHETRTSQDPTTIWKSLVPFSNKWLLNVSTQKGCIHNCKFCDVADLPFGGNLTQQEIEEQIEILLQCTPYVKDCMKVKIGFARMGEPAHNLTNVLAAIKNLPSISFDYNRIFRWLPCFNTILPIHSHYSPINVIDNVIECKERDYDGFLHFQISCNSTNEETRQTLFGGAEIFPLESIINYINSKEITERTITLNFIVMEGFKIDVKKLKKMGLTSAKFVVKLIPLNHTKNAKDNGLKTYANYSNYEKLVRLKDEFEKEGVPVVVDAIAKCEEAGLCCGQIIKNHKR